MIAELRYVLHDLDDAQYSLGSAKEEPNKAEQEFCRKRNMIFACNVNLKGRRLLAVTKACEGTRCAQSNCPLF